MLALTGRWRERALNLREWAGAEGAALAYEVSAAELEEAVKAAADDLLPPGPASKECGYSTRRLREFQADGRLKNHGTRGAPRYRRAELPQKPRAEEGARYDTSADAARLVDRMGVS